MSIIGLYENNLIPDSKVSSQACYILESIHAKKFKNPIICEISTNELEEEVTNPEIIFKVRNN
jgi:hypothetical protein